MNHDDERQLRILGLLHYAGAALASVIPMLGALYAAFGVAILLGRFPGSGPLVPGKAIGWLPIGIGVFIVLIGVTAVCLNLVAARSLRDRKNHRLCLLTSALNCVHLPLGTLLGTCTLIVLCRPAVSAAFRSAPPASGPLPHSVPPSAPQSARPGPARLAAEITAYFPEIPFPVHRFSIYSERITVECLLGCSV